MFCFSLDLIFTFLFKNLNLINQLFLNNYKIIFGNASKSLKNPITFKVGKNY